MRPTENYAPLTVNEPGTHSAPSGRGGGTCYADASLGLQRRWARVWLLATTRTNYNADYLSARLRSQCSASVRNARKKKSRRLCSVRYPKARLKSPCFSASVRSARKKRKNGDANYSGRTRAPGRGAAPPIVHQVLNSPGKPLDGATRSFMEPRFGHDFSGVRIHTDEQAAESAQSVNALAYTVGHDIVFGGGAVCAHSSGRSKTIGA